MPTTDRKTDRYVSRLCNEIGYVWRDYSEKPTREVLSEMGVTYHACGEIELDDGSFVDVYNFRASEAQFDTPGESGEEYVYAVDWAVRSGDGYQHLTFGYDHLPDEVDLRTTRTLGILRREIGLGTLSQSFRCRCCGSLTHWTETERGAEGAGDTLTLKERFQLLETNLCSLSALRDGGDAPADAEGVISTAAPVDGPVLGT